MAVQIGLGVVILVLAYFLYDSITAPWKEVEREAQLTEDTRSRMNQVRIALRQFEEVNERFPGTLDSLRTFTTTDSLLTLNPDSIFGNGFDANTFLTSARSGSMFRYSVNDTGRVEIYLLEDPDSEDYIGSAQPDITALHAASWE